MKVVIVALLVLITVVTSPASACAMFTYAKDGVVYMGNNEDFVKPGHMWFVPGRDSGRKARYGRVNFGFDDKFAQGSMNTEGLCFDGAALGEVPFVKDPKKKDIPNLVELIMDECATVTEALTYFERYNCPQLANAQIMFADATGDAAVVTQLHGGEISIVRKSGDHLLNTNTRLETSGYRCARFVLADRMLSNTDSASVDAMAKVLDAIHQRGPATTVYANVYEPAKGLIHLYAMADFSKSVTINLAEELAKGKHSVEITSLFDDAPTLETVSQESARNYDTRIELSEDTLAAFAGTYTLPERDLKITVGAIDGGLWFQPEGQGRVTLYPESETLFRFDDARHGQLSFRRDTSGKVEGFTLHQGADAWVPRVD